MIEKDADTDLCMDGEASVGGIFGDANGDGKLDVFVTNRWGTDMMLLQDENGAFIWTRWKKGKMSYSANHAAAWGDYDNDGHLDLFVSHFIGRQ